MFSPPVGGSGRGLCEDAEGRFFTLSVFLFRKISVLFSVVLTSSLFLSFSALPLSSSPFPWVFFRPSTLFTPFSFLLFLSSNFLSILAAFSSLPVLRSVSLRLRSACLRAGGPNPDRGLPTAVLGKGSALAACLGLTPDLWGLGWDPGEVPGTRAEAEVEAEVCGLRLGVRVSWRCVGGAPAPEPGVGLRREDGAGSLLPPRAEGPGAAGGEPPGLEPPSRGWPLRGGRWAGSGPGAPW